MNFLYVENSCAIITFANSNMSQHKIIMSDICSLMQSGFNNFIFDFKNVTVFSSGILGFTIGLVRIIKENKCRMFVRNLTAEARQMIQYSVSLVDSDELRELLQAENIQNVTVA